MGEYGRDESAFYLVVLEAYWRFFFFNFREIELSERIGATERKLGKKFWSSSYTGYTRR
jgi:hypothetical protein